MRKKLLQNLRVPQTRSEHDTSHWSKTVAVGRVLAFRMFNWQLLEMSKPAFSPTRLAFAIVALAFDGAAAVVATASIDVFIDAGIPVGTISMATGVDKGPWCTDAPVNLTNELRAVGTTFIRTHDAGTIDWDVNFPFPLLDADTEDPANYQWTAGDETMSAIISNGFTPYLRLGNSWSHPSWSSAPANLSALARVLLNTVRHYNDGWWVVAW
jgi:hypothetical protein